MNAEPEIGFDALNERYVNMIEAGIVDPTKVTRSALQNAASVAGIFLTTEAAVADIPETEPAMPGMGGGMPGNDVIKRVANLLLFFYYKLILF